MIIDDFKINTSVCHGSKLMAHNCCILLSDEHNGIITYLMDVYSYSLILYSYGHVVPKILETS